MYDSVWSCLVAYRTNRPLTFKELLFEVDKSRSSVNAELSYLLLSGQVFVLVLYFGNRRVPFYSLKSEVRVRVGRGGVLA